MKKKNPMYILSAKLTSFWVLIPMVLVLCYCLYYNGIADGELKLYPLMIVCICSIVFTFVYFVRVISISNAEIRYLGLFSSRDSATVCKDKTLVIELRRRRRVGILLYGNDGYNPDIKWLQPDPGDEVSDLCVFRGKAYGSIRIAERIIRYFGADRADFNAIFEDETFSKEYENVLLSSMIENEQRVIKIRMLKDVIVDDDGADASAEKQENTEI